MRTAKSEKSVFTEKKTLNDEDIWTYLPHSSPLQFVWLLILSLVVYMRGCFVGVFLNRNEQWGQLVRTMAKKSTRKFLLIEQIFPQKGYPYPISPGSLL